MDLSTCLKKMKLVGVLAFATVDSTGAPQIRNISAIHYEPDALYFFTARGKNFCKELQEDGRVQILCYTKYKEMIRLSGRAYAVDETAQIRWRDIIREVYTLGNAKATEKGYCITDACIGCGMCKRVCPQRCIEEGTPYQINQNHCLHCGNCYEHCPVKAIERR